MRQPTIQNYGSTVDPDKWQVIYCLGGTLHPNPRLYKHYWQIFTPDCGWEGEMFFENAQRLCTHDFLTKVRELQAEGKSCMVYEQSRPRKHPDNPFDMNHPCWKEATFALSWDDDTDLVTQGGHK